MMQGTISTLRVNDARASEAFYRDNLGFKTRWEHDPGEGYPVFVEVARDKVAFHLSEHQGDGPMGVQVYVNVKDADALHAEAGDAAGPLYDAPWGHRVFEVTDPDGNTLRFGSPMG